MQKGKQFLYFLLLFSPATLFLNCASDVSETYQLTSLNILKIPIDTKTPPQTYCLRYLEVGDKEQLYYLDRDNNTVCLFEINSSNAALIKKITFPLEGDKGIGKLRGFSLLGPDSIVLSSSGKPWFYLATKEGRQIERLDFRWDDRSGQGAVYTPLSSKYNSETYEKNSQLYFLQQLYGMGGQVSELANNFRPLATYDIQAEEGKLLNFSFPASYFEEGELLTEASLAFDGDNHLVYSLRCSHNLYVYDLEQREAKIINASSEFVEDFEPYKPETPQAYFDYLLTNSTYESIIYDKYRQLYYRIIRLAPKEPNNNGLSSREMASFPKSASIIILNKDFNKLSEVKLDGDLYNIYNLFVGKKGLYLSRNNPNNLDYDEDFLQFELFEVGLE